MRFMCYTSVVLKYEYVQILWQDETMNYVTEVVI